MFVNKHKAAEALGISPHTLNSYRLNPDSGLMAEVHYVKFNSRAIRYRLEFLLHWMAHRNDPATHLKYIEQQLKKVS